MNKQTCPNCGCANWQKSKNCIKCKANLGVKHFTANHNYQQNHRQNLLTKSLSDKNFQKIHIFSMILILTVVALGLYFKFFDVDDLTKISTFDQIYYRVPLPDDIKIRGAITDSFTSIHNVELYEYEPEPSCWGASLGCIKTNKVYRKDTMKSDTARFIPHVTNYQILDSELKKNSEGKLMYEANFKANIMGGKYDHPNSSNLGEGYKNPTQIPQIVTGKIILNLDNAGVWVFTPKELD